MLGLGNRPAPPSSPGIFNKMCEGVSRRPFLLLVSPVLSVKMVSGQRKGLLLVDRSGGKTGVSCPGSR